jgi:cellulose synthase/poly-beta-1,6-N-acetylglucosamine synthase-like glycosyltransferase
VFYRALDYCVCRFVGTYKKMDMQNNRMLDKMRSAMIDISPNYPKVTINVAIYRELPGVLPSTRLLCLPICRHLQKNDMQNNRVLDKMRNAMIDISPNYPKVTINVAIYQELPGVLSRSRLLHWSICRHIENRHAK